MAVIFEHQPDQSVTVSRGDNWEGAVNRAVRRDGPRGLVTFGTFVGLAIMDNVPDWTGNTLGETAMALVDAEPPLIGEEREAFVDGVTESKFWQVAVPIEELGDRL